MGDNANAATTPAGSGGLTMEQVNAAIGAAVKAALDPITSGLGELAKNQKVIADTLAADKAAAEAAAKAAPADEAKALTAADVAKLLDERDAKRQAGQNATAARDAWIAKNASKLPEAYRKLIPATEDAAAIEKAGKEAAAAFEADFKASGAVAPAAAGTGAAAGAAAAGTVDLTKLSESQVREMALKQLPAIPKSSVTPVAAQAEAAK